MNAWNIYEDLADIAAVRRYIELQMDEYNASPGVVRLHLTLFRDAIEHICRIVRVISQVTNFIHYFYILLLESTTSEIIYYKYYTTVI